MQKLELRLSYLKEDGSKALFNQNQLTIKIIQVKQFVCFSKTDLSKTMDLKHSRLNQLSTQF